MRGSITKSVFKRASNAEAYLIPQTFIISTHPPMPCKGLQWPVTAAGGH
jgi:hypothetical protein